MNEKYKELNENILNAINKALKYQDDEDIKDFINEILLVELNDILLGTNRDTKLKLITKHLSSYVMLRDDYGRYTDLVESVAKVQESIKSLDKDSVIVDNKKSIENITALMLGVCVVGFAIAFATAVLVGGVFSYILSGVFFALAGFAYLRFKVLLKTNVKDLMFPNLDVGKGRVNPFLRKDEDLMTITYSNGFVIKLSQTADSVYCVNISKNEQDVETIRVVYRYEIEGVLQSVIDKYSNKVDEISASDY